MTGTGEPGTCAKRGYSWWIAWTRQDLTGSVGSSGFFLRYNGRLLPNVIRISEPLKPGSHHHLVLCPFPPCASPAAGTGRWQSPPWKVCP